MDNKIESYMLKRSSRIANVIALQLEKNRLLWKEIVARLQKIDMPFVMTVARGSSDHAATFAKYLFETQMGLVTASAAPSVNTLYQSRQKLKNALVIAISQSGESPDICEVISIAREQGAITLGLINRAESTGWISRICCSVVGWRRESGCRHQKLFGVHWRRCCRVFPSPVGMFICKMH